MRWMTGSSIVRGKSPRFVAIASLTSFRARSRSVSSRNSRTVVDVPSVSVDVMCFTPAIFATASSTTFVTCVSSSAGAAPDCVIFTDTIGISMFGKRVTGSCLKLKTPSSISTANRTIAGTGRRIDHAETLMRIISPRSAPLPARSGERCRRRAGTYRRALRQRRPL